MRHVSSKQVGERSPYPQPLKTPLAVITNQLELRAGKPAKTL
jgi:hypothetical protein